MQIQETKSDESFALTDGLQSEGLDEPISMHTRGTYVLEDIEQGEQLRDSPVLILCPNCGTEVDQYPDGIPPYLSWFKCACKSCNVGLRRWCAVAVDAKYGDMVSVEELSNLVQSYWNRHLWGGITTAEDCPRTREFTKCYSTRAEEFGWDWDPACPLCRQSLDAIGIDWMDYHHWQREPDQGICLCRPCHDAINNEATDIDVDWEARTLGLRNKHDLQILRLAAREHLVEPASSIETFAVRLADRYNLIQSPQTVMAIIEQGVQSDEIRELLDDELPQE